MDNITRIVIAVTAVSFLGFLGYGVGLMRKSKFELKYHKSRKEGGVAERFRKRMEGDSSDLMGMFSNEIKNDEESDVSNDIERG